MFEIKTINKVMDFDWGDQHSKLIISLKVKNDIKSEDHPRLL
jgi:hypothetical protein